MNARAPWFQRGVREVRSQMIEVEVRAILIVDFGAAGRPVGVEITAPQAVPLERLNQLLVELGESPLAEQDYRPVRAA